MRLSFSIFCLFILCAACGASPPNSDNQQSQYSAKDAWALMTNLQGQFSEAPGSDYEAQVDYDLKSKDSALLEHWTFESGKTEFTVFFMDGKDLKATHYCGQAIQSTMRLKQPIKDDLLEFELISTTNLPSLDTAHNSGFAYRFNDDKSIERRETWTKPEGVSNSWLTLIAVDNKER